MLEDYNRRVELDRLRPAVGPFPPMLARTVDVDELTTRWKQLRAEREAAQTAARALAQASVAEPLREAEPRRVSRARRLLDRRRRG